MIVTSSEPAAPMTDYLADAEDRTYYSMPLIENQSECHESARFDCQVGSDLINSLEKSTERLRQTEFNDYVHAVERLHDGRIFRSDVQAVGFWTLRIIFKRFWGHFGWFFGQKSHFYFRTIPLSLQSLFAIGVTLPLFIVVAVVAFVFLTSVTIHTLF